MNWPSLKNLWSAPHCKRSYYFTSWVSCFKKQHTEQTVSVFSSYVLLIKDAINL